MSNFLNNHIVHGVVIGLLFAIPVFLLREPQVANLTIGAVLTMLYNWLKTYATA